MKESLPKEKESVYSEADDGTPKPIPVVEFAQYFKNKSVNGGIVLKEEFKARQKIMIAFQGDFHKLMPV